VSVLIGNCLIQMKGLLVKNLNNNKNTLCYDQFCKSIIVNKPIFKNAYKPKICYTCIILARIRISLPGGIIGTTLNITSLSYLGIATARVLATTHDNFIPIRLIYSSDHDKEKC